MPAAGPTSILSRSSERTRRAREGSKGPSEARERGAPRLMLLRLKTPLAESDFASILLLCKELGYETRVLDAGRELLELSGKGAPSHRARFEDHTCVAAILDLGDAHQLHELRPERGHLAVAVRDARFGAGELSLIAGPCAVEDHDRLLEIAKAVRQGGATLLRGGAYKPRTSPYSFQGLGPEALEILASVRAQTGLGVVTEVLDTRDVELVSQVADMLQVGARSMTNFPLLKEVGRSRIPVLLKRGFSATVHEFLMAAEYILCEGNENVVLCERGVRGFDRVTRNLLDVGAVAYLKRATHLPVIVDPSHAAGRADLVRPLARAGIAAGADGLMVEVHPSPTEIRSDGAQAITNEEFSVIAQDVKTLAAMDGRRLLEGEVSGATAPA